MPLALIVQFGGTESTNVACAEACGSAGSRVPFLLKSTKTTTVSVPAFFPGSVTTADPVGPSVALPVVAFGPAIEYCSVWPA